MPYKLKPVIHSHLYCMNHNTITMLILCVSHHSVAYDPSSSQAKKEVNAAVPLMGDSITFDYLQICSDYDSGKTVSCSMIVTEFGDVTWSTVTGWDFPRGHPMVQFKIESLEEERISALFKKEGKGPLLLLLVSVSVSGRNWMKSFTSLILSTYPSSGVPVAKLRDQSLQGVYREPIAATTECRREAK